MIEVFPIGVSIQDLNIQSSLNEDILFWSEFSIARTDKNDIIYVSSSSIIEDCLDRCIKITKAYFIRFTSVTVGFF